LRSNQPLVFVQGSAGRDCEEETCTAELVGGLQGYSDAAWGAPPPDGKCTKGPPGGGSSAPLFALPESCREAGCAVAVADAFSQCERRIYDAEIGGAGLSAFQELLASCQSGH
jgi:hypothetical protein